MLLAPDTSSHGNTLVLNEKKIANLIFNLLHNISSIAFPILIFPYVSRVLGVEGIGTANLVLTTATYFTVLGSVGIPIYGVREIGRVRHDQEALNIVSSELLIINFFGLMVSSIFFIFLIHTVPVMNENVSLYYIAIINIILGGFQMDWLFQGLEKFKILAIRSIITKALCVVLVYSYVSEAGDVDVFILINVVALTLANAMNLVTGFRYFSFCFRNTKCGVHYKSLFYFFCTRVTSSVYTLLDSIILGVLTSNYYVGIYSIAVKIVRILTTMIASVVTVYFAEVTRIADDDKDRYLFLIEEVIIFLAVIVFPAIVFLNVQAVNIITIFVGIEFLDAVITLQILSSLIFISTFTNFLGVHVLYVQKKENVVARSLGVGAVVCIISNLLLSPIYYHNGTAFSAVIAEFSILLFQVMSVFKLNCHLPSVNLIRLGKIILSTVVFCGCVLITQDLLSTVTIAENIIYTLLFSGLVYLVLLYVLKEVTVVSIIDRFRYGSH